MISSLKTLSLDEITRAFNTASEREEYNLTLTGTGKILEALSLTISNMNKADIPVSLMLYGSPSEDAYEVVRSNIPKDKNGNRRSINASASGIIYIGNEQRLFSICTGIESASVLRFFLSKNNYAGQGAEARIFGNINIFSNITAHEYDFAKEPDTAMAALTLDLIKTAAKYAAIEKCDIAGVFEKTPDNPSQKKIGRILRKD